MKLLTVAEMITAEQTAAQNGHSYATMMTMAGNAVAHAIQQRTVVQGKSVLVLVGKGNNGADGLIAGLALAAAGADVAFYLLQARDGTADPVFSRAEKSGCLILLEAHDLRHRVLRTRLQITDIVIDAVLGWGVSRPISGTLATILKHIKNARPPLITAVDVPSGCDLDSGAVDPHTVTADLTVTFAAPKRGHFTFPAATHCGQLIVADIGIDPTILAPLPTDIATPETMRPLLPHRAPDGHKGTFGRVLIAGGSEQYQGAPILSARAAFRAGSGLVELLVPAVVRPSAVQHLPEAILTPTPDQNAHQQASARHFHHRATHTNAQLIGPGLGDTAAFLAAVFAQPTPHLVIDADALNWLAQQPAWWEKLPATTILTPHPGEMARLVGDAIKGADRIALAREAAQKWQVVVVLKGAYTVIATPDGRVTLIPIAAPILATAGSGDVLAGIIVSLLGQGIAAEKAAVLGAYLHARAGQKLAEKYGDAGALAHEIADVLPMVRRQLSDGLERPLFHADAVN